MNVLDNSELGFYGKYLIQYYISRNGNVDLSSSVKKAGYITWCYLHMGLGDWIHYLVPPCFYSSEWPEDSVWAYWALHVAVTVCILKIVWKLVKLVWELIVFLRDGGLEKLLEPDYTFNTSKLTGVFKLGEYYQAKPPEWFKTAVVDKMYKDYFRSVSDICVEIWTSYNHKEKYATIIHKDGDKCAMSFCDKGKIFYIVHFKIGDVITFGSKDKENDPAVVSAFRELRSNVNILYSTYEERKGMIDNEW